MDPEARLIAEERMRRRDRAEGRLPAAFMDDGDIFFLSRVFNKY
jgi:hypothetical protein